MIVSGTTLLIHLSVTEPRLPRKPATHLSLSHDRIWVRSLRKLFYDPVATTTPAGLRRWGPRFARGSDTTDDNLGGIAPSFHRSNKKNMNSRTFVSKSVIGGDRL